MNKRCLALSVAVWLTTALASARQVGSSAADSPVGSDLAGQRQRLEVARRTFTSLAGRALPGGALARDSLEHELDRLQTLLSSARPLCNPEPELRRLEADLSLVAAGRPILQRPGVHRLAYRSRLDGQLHGFVLYVPEQRGHSAPLVVMLHGMNSDPLRDLGRLFGVTDGELRDSRIICDRPRLPAARGYVVAPTGFGDALYRVVGEVDVTSVVQLVLRVYPIDRRRVTITGLSMGGTGAVEVAMQHPQSYAGVLALCGYYDRRHDSSVQGEPLLPWEKQMMSVHSPVDWAVNGRGIPLRLIHGEQDGPARARRLEARWKELGFSVELELFPRGHDVWVPGYEKARALPWLLGQRKADLGRQVSFATGRPRRARAYWVRIERFADHTRWARVDARVEGPDRLLATTENVVRLHFDLPAMLPRTGRLQLHLDGSNLELLRRAGQPRSIDLSRRGVTWSFAGDAEDREKLVKRTGLSGPMEDIYYEPLVVVYGTGRGHAQRLRAVAEDLARYRKRVTLRYRVIPDRQFGPAAARRTAAILVGNELDNTVLARIGARLPIRVLSDGEVTVGSRHYRGLHIGATFIYPNPEAPHRYLRVVAGTDARSYKLFEMLPTYQPDYLVFDEGMASKRALAVLGAARSLVAGGYFDENWQLSSPPLEIRARSSTRPATSTAVTR